MSYQSEAAGGAAFAIFMAIFWIMYFLIIFGTVAAVFISRWFIFKKMGMPGWKGIIPYYSEWLLFREVWNTKMFWVYVISGAVYGVISVISTFLGMGLFIVQASGAQSAREVGQAAIVPLILIGLYGLLTIAYIVFAIVITFKLNNRLAKAFGKSTGFAAGLTFLSPIFDLILAFDKSYYIGRQIY